MSNFQPVNSNPTDGELITLCKILEAVSTGSGGGDSDVAVGADGVTRVPLNVNAAGELKVNVEASIDADLADIENALATTNGILTTTAADTATIKNESVSIDNKLPALSSGNIPVVSKTPTITENYGPQAGVIPINTILIGPVDTAQLRTISVQTASLGTSGVIVAELSNDGTIWTTVIGQTTSGASAPSTITTTGIHYYQTYGANFFRFRLSQATTGGTTTLFVRGGKEVYPQNLQSVTLSGTPPVTSYPTPIQGAGFATYHTLVSAASTNATSVKGSQGVIGTCVLTNTHTQFQYVKFFNLAVAPTMGTSTPVIQFPIAAGSTLDVSTAFAGLRFTIGIAYAITHNAALLDNTAVTAGAVLVNLSYV